MSHMCTLQQPHGRTTALCPHFPACTALAPAPPRAAACRAPLPPRCASAAPPPAPARASGRPHPAATCAAPPQRSWRAPLRPPEHAPAAPAARGRWVDRRKNWFGQSLQYRAHAGWQHADSSRWAGGTAQQPHRCSMADQATHRSVRRAPHLRLELHAALLQLSGMPHRQQARLQLAHVRLCACGRAAGTAVVAQQLAAACSRHRCTNVLTDCFAAGCTSLALLSTAGSRQHSSLSGPTCSRRLQARLLATQPLHRAACQLQRLVLGAQLLAQLAHLQQRTMEGAPAARQGWAEVV